LSEIWKSILFGIVQGITEWFPISSTGHLILLEEIMPLRFSKYFLDSFFVVIQSGSILAVLLLYFDKLWPFSRKKNSRKKRETWALWFKIIVASLPAAVVGLLFEEEINRYLYKSQVVALALVVYGILFLIIEGRRNKPGVTRMDELRYSTALMIGIFQMLALIPGTSRSGATILGAVILGCSRTIASEFSFLLAIPVMAGAGLLKLLKTGFDFSPLEWMVLLVGCLTAFLVSVVAVRSLLAYVRAHDFKVFGYYRIVLGFVVILYFWLSGHALSVAATVSGL